MLKGLRVVPRVEATLDLQHREEDDHHSRMHGKETKKKRRKHIKRKSSKRQLSSSESSGGQSDSDSNCEKISKSRRRRVKRKSYSDPSSSSDSDKEEATNNQHINAEASTRSKDSSVASRKAAGLEWMVQAPLSSIRSVEDTAEKDPKDNISEEKLQVNPKELNRFLKDGGDGYPSESSALENRKGPEAPVIGDGGLSWRLKALRRAKEQAEREGRKLDTVVEERWGSLAEMTLSVSAKRAAHAHAHLHAIRERKCKEGSKPEERDTESRGGQCFVAGKDKDIERISMTSRAYLSDVHSHEKRMREPRDTDSLYWKRRKGGSGESMRAEDKEIFHAAASALNHYENDGSFLQAFKERKQDQSGTISVLSETSDWNNDKHQMDRLVTSSTDVVSYTPSDNLSANQLAAKALQLRLRGKTREADELMNQLQHQREKEEELPGQREARNQKTRERHEEPHTGYKESLKSIVGYHKHKLEKRESGDDVLVDSILNKKDYSRSSCVDDEYDSVPGSFKDNPEPKRAKRKSSQAVVEREAKQAIQAHKRIITQEERCQFCFNNQSRPKHLTISIATSCYLMLPPWEPLVDGHCLLVPMQHEGSSRNMDEDVWEELRNYKKCLLQMFAEQGRDVIFMETVINLAQQRRHCLVECIPVPPDKAKQAPLYFKKAIDEAEDEWSQHDAKKLIDTSVKGLRGCIPKNFPYFHVEFGLRAGYVHVIDNEREFKHEFGRNVVIGMLKLPEEEMHRRRKQLTFEKQKKAALDFRAAWDPFDWTKALD